MSANNTIPAAQARTLYDANTTARHAWLDRIQRRLKRTEEVIATLFAIFILAAFSYVSLQDYEEAMTIQAERDAYTRALARCTNELGNTATESHMESQK